MKQMTNLTGNTKQAVEILVNDVGIVIDQKCSLMLTLEKKLTVFNPQIHAGEVMSSGCVGAEILDDKQNRCW